TAGQVGSEVDPTSCEADRLIHFGLADPTPLGIRGVDVMTLVGGQRSAALPWTKGGTTTSRLRIHDPTDVTYPEGCGAELVVVATLDFATDDGAFDESGSVQVHAHDAKHAQAELELDPSNLQGTYTVTEIDPKAYDSVRLQVDVEFADSALTGVVY